MASENVKDWDLPLPTPDTASDLTTEQSVQDESFSQLYYKPSNPVTASSYTEYLSKPKKRTLIDNAKQFAGLMTPSERGKRLERLAQKHTAITVEQLEEQIRATKIEERRKENILKRKENIYYQLLTKVEHQSKTQYLNFVINKFSYFISILSTTMPIPSNLLDPYARMQRGLFCNILHAIGIKSFNQDALSASDCSEYAVYRKLSHAFLSLITKALDLASTYNPNVAASHFCYEDSMDNLIKSRLMRAAQKKLHHCEKRKQIRNLCLR